MYPCTNPIVLNVFLNFAKYADMMTLTIVKSSKKVKTKKSVVLCRLCKYGVDPCFCLWTVDHCRGVFLPTQLTQEDNTQHDRQYLKDSERGIGLYFLFIFCCFILCLYVILNTAAILKGDRRGQKRQRKCSDR